MQNGWVSHKIPRDHQRFRIDRDRGFDLGGLRRGDRDARINFHSVVNWCNGTRIDEEVIFDTLVLIIQVDNVKAQGRRPARPLTALLAASAAAVLALVVTLLPLAAVRARVLVFSAFTAARARALVMFSGLVMGVVRAVSVARVPRASGRRMRHRVGGCKKCFIIWG